MLFSSSIMSNALANPTTNSFFSPKNFPHDESFNNAVGTLKSTWKVSNDSTITSMKGLNGSRLSHKQQLKKKLSHSPMSFSSSHYETGRSTEGSEAAETEDLFTRFEESDLELVKKKVKTENESSFFDFISDSSSKGSAMTKIVEDVQENLLETDELAALFRAENDKVEYKFWDNIDEPVHTEYSPEEFSAAVALLNNKYSNKHEDELNKTQTVSYVFYSAPEVSSPSQSDQVDHSDYDGEKISFQDYKTNDDHERTNDCFKKIVEDARMPSTQPGSPGSLKEGHQILRDALESITSADIQRLEPEIYLNDNLLNFYLK